MEEVYKNIIHDKKAPKGDITSDLKCALFVVLCLYKLNFNEAKTLSLIAYLLSSVGYKGSLINVTKEQYENIVNELIAEGSLVAIDDYFAYARPAALKELTAKIRAKKLNTQGTDDFIYYIEDDLGKEFSLITKFALLPGDEVKVKANYDSGKAYVINLESKRAAVIGRLQQLKKNHSELIPDEPNLSFIHFVFESNEAVGDAQPGDIVIAEITKRHTFSCSIRTRKVVKDLGNLNDKIIRAILRHDIPNSWPDNLVRSLSRIPSDVKEEETKGRVDIRDLPLVTIDGEDARDFDDAVYARKDGDGWCLYVAIADVSYYVKPGTLLDKEALQRCNSVYFPNYVVPMLPEKLSNGICSLNPNVDRMCMVCQMQIDKNGKTTKYSFYPAVMKSHARLTYTEAWRMISEKNCDFEEHKPYIQDLATLYELYQALRKARDKRGAINIESEEVKFIFDENLEISGLSPVIRNDAHMLIEECMIAANVAAANFVSDHHSQTLYRIHPKPSEKKLGALRSYLSRIGLDLPGGDNPSSMDYARFVKQIAKREDNKIIGELILRSLSKALYSPDNIGHFGLALEKYAHFTSPIRRYPDLQLHRVIKYLLEKDKKRNWGKIGARAYTKEELLILGNRCSEREVEAFYAEMDVDADLKCEYLKQFLGKSVVGTVTACTKFGAFVRLNDFYIDGMIHITAFDEFMTFNERAQTLRGSSGKVYAIGDQINVLIAAIDPDEHKIELLPDTVRSRSLVKENKPKKKSKTKNNSENKTVTNVDKDAFFKSIADITRNQQAQSDDLILKEQKPVIASKIDDSFDHDFSSKKNKKRRKNKEKLSKSTFSTKNTKKKRKK